MLVLFVGPWRVVPASQVIENLFERVLLCFDFDFDFDFHFASNMNANDEALRLYTRTATAACSVTGTNPAPRSPTWDTIDVVASRYRPVAEKHSLPTVLSNVTSQGSIPLSSHHREAAQALLTARCAADNLPRAFHCLIHCGMM